MLPSSALFTVASFPLKKFCDNNDTRFIEVEEEERKEEKSVKMEVAKPLQQLCNILKAIGKLKPKVVLSKVGHLANNKSLLYLPWLVIICF